MSPFRPLLSLLLTALVAGCARAGVTPASGVGPALRAPNVILIVTDDQGYGDLGFTGNGRISTPNLDRLAREGTTFTAFYVSPVCAPTRASLLTGRYHLRTGVRGVVEGREFMAAEEVTLAELLRGAGYATALVGKWHLGENWPWVPHAQGFQHFIGFRDGSSPYFDVRLEHNGAPLPTRGYLTDVLTDHALRFVERSRGEPFFLYLPFNAPHSPLEVPEAYLARYRDLPEHTARTYAMMEAVDRNVGRLMLRLDQLGLARNTLVLFLSDNGPLYGPGEQRHERYNAGLRGEKYSVHEGGVRVPLVAWWPGTVRADHRVGAPAAHIDILPTVLDYAGSSLPAGVEIDGRSLRPLLAGAGGWPDRTLFMSYPGERALRDGPPAPFPGGMAVTERLKMVDGTELFDLAADPGERRNVAAEHPEILARLREEYLAHWREAARERAPQPRVHVGHPEENPTHLTAHWAVLSGGATFAFGDPPRRRPLGVHGDWITGWASNQAGATWRLRAVEGGRYRVALRVRCPTESAGARTTARAEGAAAGVSLACGGAGWGEQAVGTFTLPGGEVDLQVTVAGPGAEGVEVGGVTVERLTGGTPTSPPSDPGVSTR